MAEVTVSNNNMVSKEALHCFIKTPSEYRKYVREHHMSPMFGTPSRLTSTRSNGDECGYHEACEIKVYLAAMHFMTAGRIEELPEKTFMDFLSAGMCRKTARNALVQLRKDGKLEYTYDENYHTYTITDPHYSEWCIHNDTKGRKEKTLGYLCLTDGMLADVIACRSLKIIRFILWTALTSDFHADENIKSLDLLDDYDTILPSLEAFYTVSKIGAILPYYERNLRGVNNLLKRADVCMYVGSSPINDEGRITFHFNTRASSRLANRQSEVLCRRRILDVLSAEQATARSQKRYDSMKDSALESLTDSLRNSIGFTRMLDFSKSSAFSHLLETVAKLLHKAMYVFGTGNLSDDELLEQFQNDYTPAIKMFFNRAVAAF